MTSILSERRRITALALAATLLLTACSDADRAALNATDSKRTVGEAATIGAIIGATIGAMAGNSETAAAGATIGAILGGAAGTDVAIKKGQYVLKENELNRRIQALERSRADLQLAIANAQRKLATGRATLEDQRRLLAARAKAEREQQKNVQLIRKSPKPSTREEARRLQDLYDLLEGLNDDLIAGKDLDPLFNSIG